MHTISMLYQEGFDFTVGTAPRGALIAGCEALAQGARKPPHQREYFSLNHKTPDTLPDNKQLRLRELRSEYPIQ